jgi:hypothetical protein
MCSCSLVFDNKYESNVYELQGDIKMSHAGVCFLHFGFNVINHFYLVSCLIVWFVCLCVDNQSLKLMLRLPDQKKDDVKIRSKPDHRDFRKFSKSVIYI